MQGASELTTVDARSGEERRDFGWRTVLFGFLLSRRRDHRRELDAHSLFSDWHHPWHFFLATGIMLLSSLDAFLTLQLLSRGAIEVNPVMAAVMEYGTFPFAASKMALTGLSLLIIVFLARATVFKRVRTGWTLTLFFSLYCCLVCYEFVLLITQL